MDLNIKAGTLIFRDTGTKNDSGYFLVKKAEEVTKTKWNNSFTYGSTSQPQYIDYQADIFFVNKVAHVNGKECNGKTIREFSSDDKYIKLVDQKYIDDTYDNELQAVQEKRETLTALLGEFSAADI